MDEIPDLTSPLPLVDVLTTPPKTEKKGSACASCKRAHISCDTGDSFHDLEKF